VIIGDLGWGSGRGFLGEMCDRFFANNSQIKGKFPHFPDFASVKM
jgi:hypothetical protein